MRWVTKYIAKPDFSNAHLAKARFLNEIFGEEAIFDFTDVQHENQINCTYFSNPEINPYLKLALDWMGVTYREQDQTLIFKINLSCTMLGSRNNPKYLSFYELILSLTAEKRLKAPELLLGYMQSPYFHNKEIILNNPHQNQSRERITPLETFFIHELEYIEYKAESYGTATKIEGDPVAFQLRLSQLQKEHEGNSVIVDDWVDYGFYTATRKHREILPYKHQIRLRRFKNLEEKNYILKNESYVAFQGNKGAKLCDLIRMGIPTPKTLVVTQKLYEVLNSPSGFEKIIYLYPDLLLQLSILVPQKRLGSIDRPLLLSVRSSPQESKPGFFPTILNIGINAQSVQTLEKQHGKLFAYDCYRHLLETFGTQVFKIPKVEFTRIRQNYLQTFKLTEFKSISGSDWQNICKLYLNLMESQNFKFPQNAHIQLIMALNTQIENEIPFVIQEMIFGNTDKFSGAGVANTIHPVTGIPGLGGVYLPCSQGPETVTPTGERSIFELSHPEIQNFFQIDTLKALASEIENFYQYPQNIEYVVTPQGIVITQTRHMQGFSPSANLAVQQYLVQKGWLPLNRMLNQMPAQLPQAYNLQRVNPDVEITDSIAGNKNSENCGIGILEFTLNNSQEIDQKILVVQSDDDRIFEILEQARPAGLILVNNHEHGHLALHARSLHIPSLIINEAEPFKRLRQWQGHRVVLNGHTGQVFKTNQVSVLIPDQEIHFENYSFNLNELKTRAQNLVRNKSVEELNRFHAYLTRKRLNNQKLDIEIITLNLFTHFIHNEIKKIMAAKTV